jgi:hypothetical protein
MRKQNEALVRAPGPKTQWDKSACQTGTMAAEPRECKCATAESVTGSQVDLDQRPLVDSQGRQYSAAILRHWSSTALKALGIRPRCEIGGSTPSPKAD